MDRLEDLHVCEDLESKTLLISFLWNICSVYLPWIASGGVSVYYRLNVHLVKWYKKNYRFLGHYSISAVDILRPKGFIFIQIIIYFYPNHNFFLFSAVFNCRNNSDDSDTNESQLGDDTKDNQRRLTFCKNNLLNL